MSRSACILIVAILWIFQSCKTTKPTPAAKTTLQDTYWRLTELMGKPIEIAPKGKREVNIRLLTEGNRLEAFAGCNGVGGVYEIHKGNKIHFSNLISTMMACDELPTETNLLDVLKTADHYGLNGNELVLNKGKDVPLARFEAMTK
jgi:heat shock protein HslJ